MPRLHPEDMEGRDLSPLCLAANTKEADLIEAALDAGGVEYTFEITPFQSGFLGWTRDGILFFVDSAKRERCAGIIERAGLKKLIVEG